jgi:hypothetical protein
LFTVNQSVLAITHITWVPVIIWVESVVILKLHIIIYSSGSQ